MFRSLIYSLAFENEGGKIQLRCAQAIGKSRPRKETRKHGAETGVFTGSEIYAGCSNGELIRFALQADDPSKVRSEFVVENNDDRTLLA
jgi:hypothetical protein